MATMEGRVWIVNPFISKYNMMVYLDSKKAIARIKELAEVGFGIAGIHYSPNDNQVLIEMGDSSFAKLQTFFRVSRGNCVWMPQIIKGAQ